MVFINYQTTYFFFYSCLRKKKKINYIQRQFTSLKHKHRTVTSEYFSKSANK